MRRRLHPGRWRGAALAVGALLVLFDAAAGRAEDDASRAAITSLIETGQHPWLARGDFGAEQQALRRAYAASAQAPLWLAGGIPSVQALAVLAVLGDAEAIGLAPLDYDAARLAAEAQRFAAPDLDADTAAQFDVALSVAVMRYAAHASVGRVDPRAAGFLYDIAAKRRDLAQELVALAGSPDPRGRLAALDPPFAAFATLQQALAEYRTLAAAGLPPVPAFPKLTPGDTHAELPALRDRLIALGDLPADTLPPLDPTRYDDALAAAVIVFQTRHGLAPDAVVGRATLAALMVPPAARVEQIELAMERLRWLPYGWPARYLFVNIPEFRLRGFAAGRDEPVVAMNVVVGESAARGRHRTPALQADMTYIVFRPYWMVPSGIARRELWPKIERDPSYLARNNMLVSDGRIRQRPGRGNSLGLLKFIFPNPHHVYLHDTPSKGLFARSRRDFSHGCIRVADPPALAAFVLAETPGWDRARIERAMQRGPDNRHVTLPTPVPVYLFYSTVAVDAAGEVHFLNDIYGHDATLRALVTKGYPYSS